MAYTPELTTTASGNLRRIAWAAGLPMTKTMNTLFALIPQLFDKETVCNACKDMSKCHICGFGPHQEQGIISCIIEQKKIRLKHRQSEPFKTVAETPGDYLQDSL